MNATLVAKELDSSYWVSNNSPFVYGIRLVSMFPKTNIDFPYQIIVSTYQPDVSYLADTVQQPGNIDRQGGINFYWYNGQLNSDGSKIYWNGDVVWKRVSLPALKKNNQYSTKNINATDKKFTSWLHDKLESTYSYPPGTYWLN
jgi:hypothetical protein